MPRLIESARKGFAIGGLGGFVFGIVNWPIVEHFTDPRVVTLENVVIIAGAEMLAMGLLGSAIATGNDLLKRRHKKR